MVAARKGSPLILGLGDGENIVASDVSAIVARTRSVVYLKDGEIVHLTPRNFRITTLDQETVNPTVDHVTGNITDADRGPYAHCMDKAIFEQPVALENPMRGRFSSDGSTANFGRLNRAAGEFCGIERFMFCACGTALHACMVTEHMIERFARIPVEGD